MAIGELDCLPPMLWGQVILMTGPHGYAHPASIYPCAAPASPASGGDWVGSEVDGYTSAKFKARVMSLGAGAEWWAQMDGRWVNDPKDGGPLAFPTARMAREQVERRREAERG